MARLIGRVFIENKMAVVGVVIIVLMVLFCFVGPLIYRTDQVTPNLLGSTSPRAASTCSAPTARASTCSGGS